MARRHARRAAAGVLLATTALLLAACSGGGDAPADEPPADDAGEAQTTEPADGGPPEPVELGSLGDVVGYGSGYALFGSDDGEELVEGHTTDYQTLASMTGMVTLDDLALESPTLFLSDAGLFATGQKAESTLEAGWVVARLDPESGKELWSVEAVDPNGDGTSGCSYEASGGGLVAMACEDDGDEDLTFLDAESGEEKFSVAREKGERLSVAEFSPVVLQASWETDDGTGSTAYRLDVHDADTGGEVASHDLGEDPLCTGGGEGRGALCGMGDGEPNALPLGDGGLAVVPGIGAPLGADGDVARVDPSTGEVAWSVGGGDGSVTLLGGGPDGVIVRSSETNKAALLDPATGEETGSADVVEGTIYDRSDGIYPLGDGTYVADGLSSDDTDWMVSLDILFPTED